MANPWESLIFRGQIRKLESVMNNGTMTSACYSKGLIERHDEDEIRAISTNRAQNGELLRRLQRGDLETFKTFCDLVGANHPKANVSAILEAMKPLLKSSEGADSKPDDAAVTIPQQKAMATGGTAPYADLPNWNKPLGHYDLQNLADAIANKLSGQEKRAFAQGAVKKYQREDLNEFAEILKTFMKTRDDLKENPSYENCAGVVSWIKVKGGQNGGTATIGDLYALLETAAAHQRMRFAEILREAE